MSNSEPSQVELETIELEQALELGEAWNRLKENEDFKKIITDGYLKDKVMASVSLLAVPQIKARGERPDIMEDLVAASNLQFFLRWIETQYEAAMNPILSDEEEEEILRDQLRMQDGELQVSKANKALKGH